MTSFALSFLAFNCFADEFYQDAGSWLQVTVEGSLQALNPNLDRVRIWLEGQSCWDDDWSHWYQGYARIALGYSLSEHASLWVGYTWVPTQNLDKPYISEQEMWPAFRYVLPTSYGSWMFRTMLESDFIRGNDIRFRPRQMIRFAHPLAFEPRLSLIVFDEVFIRANSTPYGGQAGYDQNRLFAGAGWAFNDNFRVELGYLNQDFDNANHAVNIVRHLIMGTLFINF